MSLRGRSYSILIVSAAGSLTSAFADLLPEARYSPVRTVSSLSLIHICLCLLCDMVKQIGIL